MIAFPLQRDSGARAARNLIFVAGIVGVISLCFRLRGFLVSSDRLEVVFLEVVGDLLAEPGSLFVGGAEMDAGPHSGVDDLFERVREPAEAPRGTGFVAEGAEGDFVGAEEVLQRVRERSGRAAVARWMVGERRREEQRRVADRCCWVEQRQPRRVGHGCGVAVGVGLADRSDRTPELPVVLVVPAADQGVSSSHVLHREQTSILDDVQVLAGGKRTKDPVPERHRLVLPEDRSVGLVRRSGYARE